MYLQDKITAIKEMFKIFKEPIDIGKILFIEINILFDRWHDNQQT